jgi:hypothetical protein
MGLMQVNDAAELREKVARHRQLVQLRAAEGSRLAHNYVGCDPQEHTRYFEDCRQTN